MRELLKLYQFWLGVGLFLIAQLLGWGLPMIIPSTPHNGILITIAAVVISAPFFIWAYVLYRRQVKSHKSLYLEQIEWETKANNLSETLIDIHNRMLELKDKAVKQYRLTHSLLEFIELHRVVMNTYHKDTGLENIEKSLKSKRVSRDKIKKRSQLDNLFEQMMPMVPIPQSLDELTKFVNKIDRLVVTPQKTYKGLDIRRNKDKRWMKLFKELQKTKTTFGDNILSDMIDKYVQWSYGVSGLMWLTDLFREMLVDNLPTQFLESEAYNPSIKTVEVMTQLRGDILKRIKELQAMNDETEQTNRSIIKDTKVQLDAKEVDKATGMNIDNVPTELSNVQIAVTAKDVREVTGLNVIARNTNFALSSKVIMCSCGEVIRSVTTCGYEPTVKCPKCGKEYKP